MFVMYIVAKDCGDARLIAAENAGCEQGRAWTHHSTLVEEIDTTKRQFIACYP